MSEGRSPTGLLAYPFYPANPWQSLMYQSLIERGVPIRPLSELGALPASPEEARNTALHLNWLTPLTQTRPDVGSTMRVVRDAIAALERYVNAGGKLIWSIHNLISHEKGHLLPEMYLASEVIRLAEAVVIMNPETADLACPFYDIPTEKLVCLPHPSYLGVYQGEISRDEARNAFSLPQDKLVLLFFGNVRPYKGLERALDVVSEASEGFDAYLLVGGEAGGGYSAPDLQRQLTANPRVTAQIGFVESNEVHMWYTAADVVFAPFSAALNSGSLHLAATFGVPVVSPQVPASAALSDEPWLFTYAESASLEAIRQLIVTAANSRAGRTGYARGSRQFAARNSPMLVSERFADLVASVVS